MSTRTTPDLSIADAAAQMGVDYKTIRRWVSSGRLAAYRYGPRLVRIRQADLDALGKPLGPGGR